MKPCEIQCRETIVFNEAVRYHCQLREGHEGQHVHHVDYSEDYAAYGESTASTSCRISWDGAKHWQTFSGKRTKSSSR